MFLSSEEDKRAATTNMQNGCSFFFILFNYLLFSFIIFYSLLFSYRLFSSLTVVKPLNSKEKSGGKILKNSESVNMCGKV